MSQELQWISFFVFYSALGTALILSITSGGRPERIGGAILLSMLVLQFGTSIVVPSISFATLDNVSLVTDLLGFVGFSLLGFFANRFWCLWAASFQLLSVSAHFARVADITVEPMAYALMRTTPTFLVIISLIFGSLNHRRRQKKKAGLNGERFRNLDRDWPVR